MLLQKMIVGEIVGFAGIFINIDIVEVMNIVVKKNCRHQGIGQKLLEALIQIARQTKLDRLSLEVNSKNEPAVNLYKKLGFKNIRSEKKIL